MASLLERSGIEDLTKFVETIEINDDTNLWDLLRDTFTPLYIDPDDAELWRVYMKAVTSVSYDTIVYVWTKTKHAKMLFESVSYKNNNIRVIKST